MKNDIRVKMMTSVQRDANETFSFSSEQKSRFNRACLFNGTWFFGKNMAALSAGWLVSIFVRISLSVANKTEPSIIHAGNGTELVITDFLGCLTTLLLCHFWIKPLKSRLKETCCTPKLLLRTSVRDAIPLIIGVSSLFLVKFIDVAVNGPEHVIHGPNNSRLFEESDVIGGLLLLISFHVIDRLLEWKWSSDPYKEIGLFSDEEALGVRVPSIQTETSPLFEL